jgi:HK97 gp10 family phage protein
MAKVTVKGLEALKAKLRNVNQKATRKTQFAVVSSTQQIVLKAQTIVPVKLGKLKQSIKAEYKNNGLQSEVSATEKYAPYIEFGTGQFVKVPKGFEKMAMSFYVNGKGRMKPKPFLIPSWASEVPIFKKKLEKIIKELKL